MSYTELKPKEAYEPEGFFEPPAPNVTSGLSRAEILARTTSVGATTHQNGEKLPRPLSDSARMLGTVAVESEAFWQDGLEPNWFCFTD